MREILFRGKDKYNGKWVEGYYTKGFRNPDGSLEDLIYIFSEDENGRRKFDYAVTIPETIGQYTGLTDKNGKKIFEDDIIYRNWHGGRVYRVIYNHLFGAFIGRAIDEAFTTFEGDSDLFEVIGNIHDNPDLLNGGDNNE